MSSISPLKTFFPKHFSDTHLETLEREKSNGFLGDHTIQAVSAPSLSRVERISIQEKSPSLPSPLTGRLKTKDPAGGLERSFSSVTLPKKKDKKYIQIPEEDSLEDLQKTPIISPKKKGSHTKRISNTEKSAQNTTPRKKKASPLESSPSFSRNEEGSKPSPVKTFFSSRKLSSPKKKLQTQMPKPFSIKNRKIEGVFYRVEADKRPLEEVIREVHEHQLKERLPLSICTESGEILSVPAGKNCGEDFFRLSYQIGDYKSAQDRDDFKLKNPEATEEDLKLYLCSKVWFALVALVKNPEVATEISALLNQNIFFKLVTDPIDKKVFRYNHALSYSPPVGEEGPSVSYVKMPDGERRAYPKTGLGEHPIKVSLSQNGTSSLLEISCTYHELANQIEEIDPPTRVNLADLGPYGAILVTHDMRFCIDLTALENEITTGERQQWIIASPIKVSLTGGPL